MKRVAQLLFPLLCLPCFAQVAVSPIVQPHVTFVNGYGGPCSGCMFYSYAAGTTTPLATYTDYSGTSTNTNPIVLDSAGGANIWPSGASYKYVLKDSTGTVIWTVDHVSGSLASIDPSRIIGTAVVENPAGAQTITQPAGTNFNVITTGAGKFQNNGNQVLDVTTGLQLSPAASQAVVQPAGTSLSVNILNGVYNAATFTGADIGAKINAAIAAVGCGTVIVPAGTYSFSTTIVKPRCILLKGQGLVATKLSYTSNSGVAVAVGDSASGAQYGVGGIEDIGFVGTSTGLGTTNTSTGIWIGGDPAWGQPCGGSGSSGVVPCDYNGDNQTFTRVGVSGFEIGVNTANNAYVDTFISSNLFANWYGVSQSANSFNSGENNRLVVSDVFNNSGAGFYSANNWKLFGTSIDFNNDGTPTVLATHAQIINTGYECFGCHAEGYSGAISSGTGNFNWYGGNILLDSSASITDPALLSSSAAGTSSSISGTNIFAAHTVTALTAMTGGLTSGISVDSLSGNGNNTIGVTLSSGSNPGFKYLRPNLEFIDGGTKTIDGDFALVQSNANWLQLKNPNNTRNGMQLTPLNHNSIFFTDTTVDASLFDLTVHSITPLTGKNATATLTNCTLTFTSGILTASVGTGCP